MNFYIKLRFKFIKMTRIGIIGAGAIGSLFGGYLANIDDQNINVTFFCTSDHANAIKKDGLRIKREKDSITLLNINVYDDLKEYLFDGNFNFDYLFLTTKTYDTERAIIQYSDIIEKSKWFIVLQNGLGNEDFIKSYVNEGKIIRVITSHGATFNQPGFITHTGKGFTYLGFPYLSCIKKEDNVYQDAQLGIKKLNLLLNLAGFDSSVEDNIIIKIWQKAIVNIGINAIGALTRLNNGKILEIDYLKDLIDEAINEAIKVGKESKIPLSNEECIFMAHSVAKKTYNNKNSMLQDILKGKRTEIDYLNGKIVSLAKKMYIYVPVNEILTKLIKGLEHSS